MKRDVGFIRQLENSGGKRPKIGGFSEELQILEDIDKLDQSVNTQLEMWGCFPEG